MIDVKDISSIVNRAAQESQNLQEFYWKVIDRLPEDVRHHFTKKLAGEFYVKHKEDGRPFDPSIFSNAREATEEA